MACFDLPGSLRRIRRVADLSQRELAERLGVSKSAVAAAEAGDRRWDVDLTARAAAIAGLRLALVDGEGHEVAGMAEGTVRDASGRRFPAHLDTRHGDEDWWHGDQRYSRARPWYTFDRDRSLRDQWRHREGTPEDHQRPQPGDGPAARQAARRAQLARRRREELDRRIAAGEVPWPPEPECSCPPECDALDEDLRLVHAERCPCRCELD